MDLSSAPIAVAEALSRVQAGIKTLGYDERNQHGSYDYVSADKFYAEIRPLLNEAGLLIVADLSDMEVLTFANAKKEDKQYLKCRYDFYFVHQEGGAVFGPFRRGVMLPYTGAQSSGAADTYAEKQFLRSLFKVPTGDHDADAEPPQRAARAKPVRVESGTAAPPANIPVGDTEEILKRAREAANQGKESLNAFWRKLNAGERNLIKHLVLPGADGTPGSLAKIAADADGRKGE